MPSLRIFRQASEEKRRLRCLPVISRVRIEKQGRIGQDRRQTVEASQREAGAAEEILKGWIQTERRVWRQDVRNERPAGFTCGRAWNVMACESAFHGERATARRY